MHLNSAAWKGPRSEAHALAEAFEGVKDRVAQNCDLLHADPSSARTGRGSACLLHESVFRRHGCCAGRRPGIGVTFHLFKPNPRPSYFTHSSCLFQAWESHKTCDFSPQPAHTDPTDISTSCYPRQRIQSPDLWPPQPSNKSRVSQLAGVLSFPKPRFEI